MTSADDIATLIRQQNWKNGGHLMVDHDEAVDLIEQYAQMVAAGARVEATREAFDRAIATVSSAATTRMPADQPANELVRDDAQFGVGA